MNNLNFEANRTYAQSLDHTDKLKKFRSEFYFPKDKNGYSCVYLCGNSLGLQPKITAQYLQEELNGGVEFVEVFGEESTKLQNEGER